MLKMGSLTVKTCSQFYGLHFSYARCQIHSRMQANHFVELSFHLIHASFLYVQIKQKLGSISLNYDCAVLEYLGFTKKISLISVLWLASYDLHELLGSCTEHSKISWKLCNIWTKVSEVILEGNEKSDILPSGHGKKCSCLDYI